MNVNSPYPFIYRAGEAPAILVVVGGDMIRLKVNGQERSFDGDPQMPLLWYLRDILGLTGTKFGCGMALCGACTVHNNGEAIRSCTTSLKEVAGGDITTIEGIARTRLFMSRPSGRTSSMRS